MIGDAIGQETSLGATLNPRAAAPDRSAMPGVRSVTLPLAAGAPPRHDKMSAPALPTACSFDGRSTEVCYCRLSPKQYAGFPRPEDNGRLFAGENCDAGGSVYGHGGPARQMIGANASTRPAVVHCSTV
jgi:hypothetical protein